MGGCYSSACLSLPAAQSHPDFSYVGCPNEQSLLSAAELKPNPEETAGWLSRLTFSYVGSLIRLGYQQPLRHEDMWDMNQADQADLVSKTFLRTLQGTAQPSAPQVGGLTSWTQQQGQHTE